MDQKRLTHLRQLEAESIHIIREVAAEFSNPVMMYSIGKDQRRNAASERASVLSGTCAFAAARRYRLEIPWDAP